MNKQQTLCVLCGGQSAEHRVSLLSSRNVVGAVDRKYWKLIVVGIDRSGTWHRLPADDFLQNAENPEAVALASGGAVVAAVPHEGGMGLLDLASGDVEVVDMVFPVLHGTYGEDGAIQGLLAMLNVPCVGCDLASSANCMDKDLCKRLLVDHDIPVARWRTVCAGEPYPDADEVSAELGFPVFVKPARLGSSVGISKVRNGSELAEALTLAFRYDTKVLIEEFVPGREIECAVLGNREPRASVPGEVVPIADFYSYEAKYIDDDGARLIAPAVLEENVSDEIRSLAVRAFRDIGCSGLSRVDFFLCEDGKIVLNEINTIPGFTRISMYPRLWNETGLAYPELVANLLLLAEEHHAEQAALLTDLP